MIVACRTGPLNRNLPHLRDTSHGLEVAAFRSQPPRWPRSSRFVVIRRPQPEEPPNQLTPLKMGKSPAQVRVTQLPLQPLTRWRFSSDRAGGE